MKKRYNGMRQKKTRKPAKASAEAGFFVLGKENLMTIEYMARAASRHETAFAHAMLHAIAVYRAYGGRFVWPTA